VSVGSGMTFRSVTTLARCTPITSQWRRHETDAVSMR
jgi:hypothetical protein